MSFATPQVVVASAARTTTGQSASIGLTDAGGHLNLLANVTAAAGTSPSLTLSVQWSADGTTWYSADASSADAFSAVTAAGAVVKQFAIKAPFYRVAWLVSGTTPSFTFSVTEYVTP